MKARKAAVLTVIAAAAVFGGIKGWYWLRDNKLPNFSSRVDLYVYPGDSPESIMSQICSLTTVKYPDGLAGMFREKEVATYCKPGHYVIEPSHTSVYVARMLNNGWQTPVNVTLSGTLRLRGEIARKISGQLMVDSTTVRNAFEDKELLARYGFDPVSVFGLMIPDTYEMYWTDSIEQFLDRQKQAYDAYWTPDNEAKARRLGLSKKQVSIVASIVKGESNYEPEFPKIAGVYLTRLKKGMKLQADPTIAFCYDYDLRRVRKSHLSVDSPYNTYLHEGLPPGPIYVPTRACLDAVLNADMSKGYIFFCADPSFNGSHRFAVSYSDHLANARAFQRALDARAKGRK